MSFLIEQAGGQAFTGKERVRAPPCNCSYTRAGASTPLKGVHSKLEQSRDD